MKNSVKSLLVAAAVTGLLGAVVVPVSAEDPKPAAQTEKDKNSCKANNSCSGKDAKAKKAAAKKDKKAAAAASKDKNSCKSANGCSSKEEKKN